MVRPERCALQRVCSACGLATSTPTASRVHGRVESSRANLGSAVLQRQGRGTRRSVRDRLAALIVEGGKYWILDSVQ